MSLTNFKSFVQANSALTSFVKNGEMTWQKFYELYELYGPTHEIWNKYLVAERMDIPSFKGIFNMIKNIDMTELQNGIGSLQKGIGYLKDFVATRESEKEVKDERTYEPRPIYKYFDD